MERPLRDYNLVFLLVWLVLIPIMKLMLKIQGIFILLFIVGQISPFFMIFLSFKVLLLRKSSTYGKSRKASLQQQWNNCMLDHFFSLEWFNFSLTFWKVKNVISEAFVCVANLDSLDLNLFCLGIFLKSSLLFLKLDKFLLIFSHQPWLIDCIYLQLNSLEMHFQI